MVKYKVIKNQENYLLYNNLTGIFFEVNNYVVDSLKQYEQGNVSKVLDDFFQLNMFYMIDYDKFDSIYPKLSKDCIFNKKKLLYNNYGTIEKKELTKIQFDILLTIQEAENLLEVFEQINVSYNIFCDLLFEFTKYELQVIKLFNKDNLEDMNLYFNYNFGDEFKHGERAVVDNVDYYNKIKLCNIEEQFLAKETTISYMLRKPSPILNWKTYGKVLFDLIILDLGKCKYVEILEIGAGLGDVAYEFCRELEKQGRLYKYTICDISAAMLEYQKKKLEPFANNVNYVKCNIEEYCHGKYDIIICNEVIADLKAIKITSELMGEYSFLMGSAKSGYLNIGALRTLKNISCMLKTEGKAIITEYYDENGRNEISNQMKDHTEVSINFEVINDYMTLLGVKFNILPLSDFFQINDHLVLSDSSLKLLSVYLDLEKRFYTKEEVLQVVTDEWNNLHFQKVSDWFRLFKCLYISK